MDVPVVIYRITVHRWSTITNASLVEEEYVGYLSSGFEYFLSGFAYEPTPIKPTLAPSRTRRALSTPLITFPNRPPLTPQKCKILQKKWRKTSKSQYFLAGFVYDLIQIKTTLAPSRTRRALSTPLFTFRNRPPLAPLKCQILWKIVKISVFPFRIRSWADSNETVTGSK
jgi:hypothetical protein